MCIRDRCLYSWGYSYPHAYQNPVIFNNCTSLTKELFSLFFFCRKVYFDFLSGPSYNYRMNYSAVICLRYKYMFDYIGRSSNTIISSQHHCTRGQIYRPIQFHSTVSPQQNIPHKIMFFFVLLPASVAHIALRRTSDYEHNEL